MKKTNSLYHGHRFPAVVMSCAVRRYFRFSFSLRDIEELLLERGVAITYETIRWAPVQIGAPGRLSSGFDERDQAMGKPVDIDRLFNGRHSDREVIVLCVRWYTNRTVIGRRVRRRRPRRARKHASRGFHATHDGAALGEPASRASPAQSFLIASNLLLTRVSFRLATL